MKIGIAYDTKDMYKDVTKKYNDFADEKSILSLQSELKKLGYDVILLGNVQNIIEQLKEDTFNCDIV